MNSFSIKDILHDKRDTQDGLSIMDQTSRPSEKQYSVKMDSAFQAFVNQTTETSIHDFNSKLFYFLKVFVNYALKQQQSLSLSSFWNRKPFFNCAGKA